MRKIFFLLLFPAVLFGQTPAVPPKPAEYRLTDLQTQTLQNMQKDAQLASIQAQQAQQILAAKVTALQEEANKVKKENSWPDSTAFDIAQVKFCDALDK